jgi:hypothetical protein
MDTLSLLASEQQNALKIAVIEEQIVGLREQQRAHNAATQIRFDSMEKKLDELTAIMNRGKGAYAASMALAAAIGAILIEAMSLFSSFVHSK